MNGSPGAAPPRTGNGDVLLDLASVRRAICDSVVHVCTDVFRNQLRSIIVTGSLARDEASLLLKEDSWTVHGDAEFMIVFERNAPLPIIGVRAEIRRRIENDLLQRNIRCKVDLSVVHQSYFRHMPAHIFTYELKHCGRVIAGDECILQSIPDYSAEDLSLEDAWRLLSNRLLEVLECATELTSDKPLSAALRYKILKLYLDMGTSFLVFVQAYAPTYAGRRAALQRLSRQKMTAGQYPFDLAGFADLVARCTDEKLLSQRGNDYPIELPCRGAIQTARALWRWELARLVGTKSELTDLDLFNRWISLQPFMKRIRGWLYIVRARGWRRSYLVCLRWLKLRKASPRHWIYLVSSSLIFQLTADANSSPAPLQAANCVSLSTYLPIHKLTAKNQSCPSWEHLAQDVVWNYQQFVVGTRA
jgi:hypothetical protein